MVLSFSLSRDFVRGKADCECILHCLFKAAPGRMKQQSVSLGFECAPLLRPFLPRDIHNRSGTENIRRY
jgi:hypothetical protein